MASSILVPLSAPRMAEAAALLARAFADDPGFMYALPSAERRPEQLRWLFERLLCISARFGHIYALGDESPEGEPTALQAIAMWLPPRAAPGPWDFVRHGLLELPFRFGASAATRLGRCLWYMERTKHEIMRGRPHWYLDEFAVEPALQGRGLGRLALRLSMDEHLAREALPILLYTAKERNVGFYEASGFAVRRSDWIGAPADGFRMWTMLRDPGA